MQMDAKLNKNSGQMLKALNDVLMQKQKAGNDLLRQAQASNEPQTQRIEQTDNRAVAIMLSAEAKESYVKLSENSPKRKNNKSSSRNNTYEHQPSHNPSSDNSSAGWLYGLLHDAGSR
jgi:hypothetical protein